MTIEVSGYIQLGGIPGKLFSGIITDLNVWSRPLNDREQEGFHFCKSDMITSIPDSVNWDKSSVMSKVGHFSNILCEALLYITVLSNSNVLIVRVCNFVSK